MSRRIQIHSFADVDRSGKVRWTARELGYEIDEQRLSPGAHLQPEYLALNPYGQVPTARIGDQKLIESSAICIVLAERHPEKQLIPSAPSARESFWQTVNLVTTTLETPTVNYFLSQRGIMDERWKDLLAESLPPRLRAFAERLPEEGYLYERFTLADVFAGYVLRIGVQSGLLAYEASLGAYLDRLRARPAAVEARIFDSLDI
ncbi:MAG: glutathione S-transferase family protein [Xanthomonadales bacterium]|nr:glutathione S-transferase family protein [Xanthomonadales bacterium]